MRNEAEKTHSIQISAVDASKAALLRAHNEAMEKLRAKLEKAERDSRLNAAAAAAGGASGGGGGASRDEEWFGCPVCLMLLTPPTRIFQCPEGHILCEECKENPAMVHCPQCRYGKGESNNSCVWG